VVFFIDKGSESTKMQELFVLYKEKKNKNQVGTKEKKSEKIYLWL
jgi:hypothetical protein